MKLNSMTIQSTSQHLKFDRHNSWPLCNCDVINNSCHVQSIMCDEMRLCAAEIATQSFGWAWFNLMATLKLWRKLSCTWLLYILCHCCFVVMSNPNIYVQIIKIYKFWGCIIFMILFSRITRPFKIHKFHELSPAKH